MNFDLASLERRIAKLESSQTASLRFGRVTSIKGGKCRVQFQDGQGMNSFELSTIQKRVKKDKDICMPDVEEPVACLFSGQGCEQGLCLGAYYNGQEEDPGQEPYMDYRRYEDGTEIWYDRQEHKLVAKVQGDAEISCEKTITAFCKEEASITTEKTLTATAKLAAEVHSETEITLKAPLIHILGVMDMAGYTGGATEGTLRGSCLTELH